MTLVLQIFFALLNWENLLMGTTLPAAIIRAGSMYRLSKNELSTSYLLSNREPRIGLNDSKLILIETKGPSQTHLESMWNHSKPSQVPYFSKNTLKNSFLEALIHQKLP